MKTAPVSGNFWAIFPIFVAPFYMKNCQLKRPLLIGLNQPKLKILFSFLSLKMNTSGLTIYQKRSKHLKISLFFGHPRNCNSNLENCKSMVNNKEVRNGVQNNYKSSLYYVYAIM